MTMEILLWVNLEKEDQMVMENIFGQLEATIKESFQMVWSMVVVISKGKEHKSSMKRFSYKNWKKVDQKKSKKKSRNRPQQPIPRPQRSNKQNHRK